LVYAFFVGHWLLSVLFQSMFLHRYAAHRMYNMSPRAEKIMHFLCWMAQGSSYLSPRGYAILHREHHAFSDTEQDPHAPGFHQNALAMMWRTKKRYDDYAHYRAEPEARFLGGYPEWKLVDQTLGQSWVMRVLWSVAYAGFYFAFATHWWQIAFMLPFHFVMGPVHGAIVNWCGHKYGYRNFDNADKSRNTLPIDVLTMGELFQNNHHKFGASPNFAARWFEIDPTWQVMRVLHALGAIQIRAPESQVLPEPLRHAA
jgi:stearoyl-CoA desaturase (delta-9 desaturase)